jgi:signal transduction histidine kinase
MDPNALVPSYTPPVPRDEGLRLEALARYQIIDTPPEEAFENIIDVATTTLGMPIGLITFLDKSRQWFKSSRGVRATESARIFSFCAETITIPDGVLVTNALDDLRFRYNPFVTGPPFIRFYAGVPLYSSDGYALGSLGVADLERHQEFDQQSIDTLKKLAKLVMDEAELRLAKAKLRTEKQKLEFAMTSAGLGQWSWDLELDAFELPSVLGSLIDRQPGELALSKDASLGELLEVVHAHDRPQLAQAFERLVDQHSPISAAFRIIVNEQNFWMEIHADYAPGSDSLVIGTARDVTEREQWRNKTIRVDRLDALSSLGAGVAHEINNPLSVVTTNLYLLSAWFRRNQEAVADNERAYIDRLLDLARRGAVRVEDIVSSMLELSRSDETGEERAAPCAVLESVLLLLRSDIPAKTTLETRLEPAPAVRCRPSALAQVFVNLLLNAIDAVERSATDDGESRIEVHCQPRGGDWVDITVRDTGPGLADDARARIFNPFFTTKPPGKGTGLGLAIAHSIVESLGGDISIESARGAGTIARVSLPADKRPLASPPEETRPVVH